MDSRKLHRVTVELSYEAWDTHPRDYVLNVCRDHAGAPESVEPSVEFGEDALAHPVVWLRYEWEEPVAAGDR